MKEFPQIFAFYSFKGGVGRSMAVLNLAYALAAIGRHVLVLDMDLSRSTNSFAHSNRIDQLLLKPLVFSELRASVGLRRPPMAPSASDYPRSDPLLRPFFVDFAPTWG
jgi:cellulose biosynthesis protein BcsQ